MGELLQLAIGKYMCPGVETHASLSSENLAEAHVSNIRAKKSRYAPLEEGAAGMFCFHNEAYGSSPTLNDRSDYRFTVVSYNESVQNL